MSSGPLAASSIRSSKYLRVFTRLAMPALMVMIVAACAGEAFVAYEGTVVEAATAGYTFDDAPNPDGLPPIADARVQLRVCLDGCVGTGADEGTRTSSDGSWGPLDTVFGGFIGKNHIEVRVTADGYRPFVYSVIYEDTEDPIGAEAYLNIALERE